MRFPYAPQPPVSNDDETNSEYEIRLSEFNRRKDYIEGMHTNSKYTSVAHYWLIKEMINCNKWNFISDEDSSIIDTIMRVFTQSIKDKESHYFLCKLNRNLSKKEAYNLFTEAKKELNRWVKDNGKKGLSSFDIQKQIIAEKLAYHSLYDYEVKDGKSYIYSNYNPRYAQYAITILRIFYNFCWAFRSWNGDVLTTSQRIGITDKQFTYNDIIYFS